MLANWFDSGLDYTLLQHFIHYEFGGDIKFGFNKCFQGPENKGVEYLVPQRSRVLQYQYYGCLHKTTFLTPAPEFLVGQMMVLTYCKLHPQENFTVYETGIA